MDWIKETLVEKYGALGLQRLDNETLLIGKAPFIAPLAYLHSLYAPINGKDLASVEKRLNVVFPNDLVEFYKKYNGLKLFNSSLSVFGLRNNFSRSLDDAYQPYDIFTPNLEERIKDAPESILFIGSYRLDGSKVYVNLIDSSVSFCSKESVSPLVKWDNIESWLHSELERLINLHTVEGKNIPFKPTTPVGGEEIVQKLLKMASKMKKPPYWYSETKS